MRTRHLIPWTAAIVVAGMLATAATPAAAAPVPSSTVLIKSTIVSDVSEVRYRGRRGGGAGVAAGLAAGLIIGGLIASSPYHYGGPAYYYGPPGFYPPGYYGPIYRRYYGPPGWMAYCFSRYRSFDPATGTYMGYDGRRHYCR